MTTTARAWTIVVPFDVQRLSPNRRLHHLARARLNAQCRRVANLAWRAVGSPRVLGPVRVTLVLRRARQIDQQNAWAAAKAAMDGVFVGGMTEDDGPEWVRLGEVRQEISRQWRGREECVFVAEELASGE